MTYRKIQQETIRIANGKKLACFFTFKQGYRLRYEVRAGKLGTGQLLARALCVFGYRSQKAAADKISKKLGGLEFLDENNMDRFPAGSLFGN